MDNKLVRTDGRDWPDFGYQVGEAYRGDGKRHSRYDYTGASPSGTLETIFSYGAGFDLLTEEDDSEVKTYIGGLAEALGDDESVGTYRYYQHDHLGSVREVRDDSLDVQAAFDYTPFGAPYFAQEAATGLGPSDLGHVTRRFTGHHLDLRSGNYRTPFRTYSPTTARWLQPDPLGMVDGPNMYAYVGGNPENFTDPLGLEIFLQSYQVKVFGLVRTGQQHTYIAIIPKDQLRYANHPSFSYSKKLGWFTTLGPPPGNLLLRKPRLPHPPASFCGGPRLPNP